MQSFSIYDKALKIHHEEGGSMF